MQIATGKIRRHCSHAVAHQAAHVSKNDDVSKRVPSRAPLMQRPADDVPPSRPHPPAPLRRPAGVGSLADQAALPRRTFETRGGPVETVVMGPHDGPTVVCLHGWGRSSGSHDVSYLFAPLVARGYRVVAPDMPGFGRSSGIRHNSRSETNMSSGGPVEIVEDILDALRVRRANFFGYSWGGGIALSLALARPDRVERLALFHASFTDHDNVLQQVHQPTALIWIPEDQVHPISWGRRLESGLRQNALKGSNVDFVALPRQAFRTAKSLHAYASRQAQVVPEVVNLLTRL